MTTINGYHAHIYFDAASIDQARALCERTRDEHGVEMGRVHERLVGPHPMWSCQLAFGPDLFGKVVPFLSLNRNGLTVFIHAETGEVLVDHTDHAIWMGQMMELNLSVFD